MKKKITDSVGNVRDAGIDRRVLLKGSPFRRQCDAGPRCVGRVGHGGQAVRFTFPLPFTFFALAQLVAA